MWKVGAPGFIVAVGGEQLGKQLAAPTSAPHSSMNSAHIVLLDELSLITV